MKNIAVAGTPPKDDGSAGLQYTREAVEEVGQSINGYTVIEDKSTVAIGTGRKTSAG